MTDPAAPPPLPIDYFSTPQPPPRRAPTIIAWLVILAAAAYIITTTAIEKSRAPAGSPTREFEFRIAARYAVGVARLFSALDTPGAAEQAASLLPQIDEAADTPGDRLRAAIVAGEIAGSDAANERLDQLAPLGSGPFDEVVAVRLIYDPDGGGTAVLTPEQREALARYGWFGDLALSHGKGDNDPARRAALRPAVRAAVTMLGAAALAFLAFVTGVVLLIFAVIRWSTRGLATGYQPPTPLTPTGPFLEAFAAYIAGMVGVSALARLLLGERMSAIWFVIVVLPAAIFWPLLRGVSRADLRAGLGWHVGRGVWREIGAGIVGYLAALPLLALGMVMSLVLQRLSGSDTSHPIVNELGQGGARTLAIFFLAAVWAPVVEETMFRGALYHHLRRRFSWAVTAVLVALLFAAVHPQGWAGIPALGAIAIAFAGIREWRGSIIAPTVAHAINNGAVTLLLTLLLS